jgi:hypothetical protein
VEKSVDQFVRQISRRLEPVITLESSDSIEQPLAEVLVGNCIRVPCRSKENLDPDALKAVQFRPCLGRRLELERPRLTECRRRYCEG